MGFWLYMLAASLLIPLSMVGLGRHFQKKAPAKINRAFGYRTPMSMKNWDTWEFAHHRIGRIWYRCGLALLPATVLAMAAVMGKDEDIVGMAGGVACCLQMVLMAAGIILTEKALKKTFDSQGRRR